MTWICKKFDELRPKELYAIIQLRNEVFVVEQNCVFQDADNKDQSSWHFMGWENDTLVAYTRIIPHGIAYAESSIGRVVTSPAMRGKGLGEKLMIASIDQLYKLFGKTPIKIGAQLYLQQFYTRLGFTRSSNIYLEDGIEHIEMIKR